MDSRPFQIAKPLSQLFLKTAGGEPADASVIKGAYEAALVQAYATAERACVLEVRRYAALLGLFATELRHRHADWLPDMIPPAELHGISLVSVSMNRTENLLKALESWLELPNLAEILIVDWSSEAPLSTALEQAGITDARLRVIRVEGEPRWILTHAFNLAIRLSRGSAILKLDADIVLKPDFLTRNPLPSNSFLAGNWRTARPGQTYVNGVLLTSRRALMQVGGFNEFITTYGWDDEDLYQRLKRAGIVRHDVDPESIEHLSHDDVARIGAAARFVSPGPDQSLREVTTASPRYLIHRNRFLTQQLPAWSDAQVMTPFCPVPAVPGTLQRALSVCPDVPTEMLKHAGEAALDHLLRQQFGWQVETMSSQQRAQLLDGPAETAVERLPTPAVSPTRARLVIDARHGLGNRLRAIGSAAAVAQATDRELIILWEPDDHCDCCFGDLFEYRGAVLDQGFLTEAEGQGMTVLNYMPLETGAVKGQQIPDRGDLYLRSAFTLNSPHTSWKAENTFLQGLVPVAEVSALVASVPRSYTIAAHVRMQGGTAAAAQSYEAAEGNWSAEDHADITHWRAQSQPERFLSRIASVEKTADEPVFLAADHPAAYEIFQRRLGGRLLSLPRMRFDRSVEQLRYALADALLLAQAPVLLGSTWSSFTELARRLAPMPQHFESSGRDF